MNLLLIKAASNLGGLSPPLGLLYLAASVRESIKGVNIKVIDLALEDIDIKKEVTTFQPAIIGISTSSCDVLLLKRIARRVKETDKEIKIVVGGPHVSSDNRDIIRDENIDIAVVGEAETTFPELLKTLSQNGDLSSVDGIIYKKDDEIVFNQPREFIENIDDIPFPAWDLIDIKKYSSRPNWNGVLRRKPYMSIITSRGCPYGCIYCHNTVGKKFRPRSAENVFAEIKELYEKHGIREFHIIEDIFNLDANRAKKICDLIIDYNKNIAISFPNGLRGDVMDEELVDKLKQAGTYKINYAIESPVPRIQKMINKNINLPKLEKIIDYTAKKNIIVFGFFMIGFPTETKEEILETIEYACKSKLDIVKFSMVTPLPGTKLYEMCPEEGTICDSNFHSPHSCSELSFEDSNELYLLALWKFYTNPKKILRILSIYKFAAISKLFSMYSYVLQNDYRDFKTQSMDLKIKI
jgi:radical SAM superfamily enzyme YgiQ (UPF0313 family)